MLLNHDDTRRKVIHVSICSAGAEQLRAFCSSHGVTITAFLDGLSHALTPIASLPIADLADDAPLLGAALMHARQIDASRRSREPR